MAELRKVINDPSIEIKARGFYRPKTAANAD